jgi:hypothetical protein
METSLQALAQAFEAWENNYRANPEQFLTAEEIAAEGVSELSASRAAYMYALLMEIEN